MTCGATPAISLSAKRIDPDCGLTTPVTALMTEVLPAPFGPMMPWISPPAIASDNSVTAETPPKRIESASISRSAIGRLPGRRLGRAERLQFADQADQPSRQEQKRAEQRLGQRREHYGPRNRTGDRAEPANDDESDLLDRGKDAELGRIDETDDAGQKAAGEPCEGSIDRKRDHLKAPERDAERLGGERTLPHGIKGAAIARALYIIADDDGTDGEREDEKIKRDIGLETKAENRRPRHLEPANTAGVLGKLLENYADKLEKAECDQREIKPRQSPRRIAERSPEQRRDNGAHRQRDQRRQPETGREQRGAVSADPHERSVAKGDLAAIAAEQIEADSDDDVDHRQFHQVEVIAGGDQRQASKKCQTNKDQQQSGAHCYTRWAVEAPARPCGRKSSSRMSTPNGTRFFKVAPKKIPA